MKGYIKNITLKNKKVHYGGHINRIINTNINNLNNNFYNYNHSISGIKSNIYNINNFTYNNSTNTTYSFTNNMNLLNNKENSINQKFDQNKNFINYDLFLSKRRQGLKKQLSFNKVNNIKKINKNNSSKIYSKISNNLNHDYNRTFYITKNKNINNNLNNVSNYTKTVKLNYKKISLYNLNFRNNKLQKHLNYISKKNLKNDNSKYFNINCSPFYNSTFSNFNKIPLHNAQAFVNKNEKKLLFNSNCNNHKIINFYKLENKKNNINKNNSQKTIYLNTNETILKQQKFKKIKIKIKNGKFPEKTKILYLAKINNNTNNE